MSVEVMNYGKFDFWTIWPYFVLTSTILAIFMIISIVQWGLTKTAEKPFYEAKLGVLWDQMNKLKTPATSFAKKKTKGAGPS